MLNLQSLRVTRGALALLLVVTSAAFLLSGCSPAAESASKTASSPEQSADRAASWLHDKFRLCVQNKTARNVTLKWNSYMQGDDGEYLDEGNLTQTLGPDAFNCAVSYAVFGSEHAKLWIDDAEMRVSYAGSPIKLSGPDSEGIHLREGVPDELFLATVGNQALVAKSRVSYALKTFGHVEAFPLDVRFELK